MGKKRVIEKTKDEQLEEKKRLEAIQESVESRVSKSKSVKQGRVYVCASYNNTIITITNEKGDVLSWSSAGSLGFRGPKKATPYAATKVVDALMEKIKRVGLQKVEVFVSGIGSGRDSAIRALGARGLNISRIKDITPIPHNGPRLSKPRRV